MKKRWCFIWFALILSSCGTTNVKKYIPLYKEGDSCKIYITNEESFAFSIVKLDYGYAELKIIDSTLAENTMICIDKWSPINKLIYNGEEMEERGNGMFIFLAYHYQLENITNDSIIRMEYSNSEKYYKKISFDSVDYRAEEKRSSPYYIDIDFYV